MARSQSDDRLGAVDSITIDFEDFKTALRNNFLTETDRNRGGNTVLRLLPPFEAEMKSEKYFSEQGVRYDSNWDEKPVHIRPHLVLVEGDTDFLNSFEWPTEANQRDVLTEGEIEDSGGIDAIMEEAQKWFWDELAHSLPETVNLGEAAGFYESKTVEVEWVNVE